MRKIYSLILSLIILFSAASSVLAHSAGPIPIEEIYQILEVGEPSVLPTNFLYTFRNFSRGFKMLFTFDAVEKAELELKFSDEKLAELQKVAKNTSDKKSLEIALENYLSSHRRINERLESLKDKNKNIDALLERLAKKTLEHQELFRELEEKLEEKELERAAKEIAKNIRKGIELDKEKFKGKIKDAVKRAEEALEKFEILEELEDLDEELKKELEDIDFEELEEGREEKEEQKDAKESLEEMRKEIKDIEKNVESSKDKLPNSDLVEIKKLLSEANKHLGFAETSLEKEDLKVVEAHLGHVEDFVGKAEKILEKPSAIKPEIKKCIITGCSRQICSDKEETTTCEVKEEYACYRNAKCGVKTNEKCGWIDTPELRACIQNVKTPQPEIQPAPTPTQSQTAPLTKEFFLEADDYGFYPPTPITVPKNSKVKINFTVRANTTYYGGLDFRSSKFTTKMALPGNKVTVEFSADESFTITSFWPASGIQKSTLTIKTE